MKSIALLIFLISIGIAHAQDKKLTISGFSELRVESRFGDPADKEQADLLKATEGGDDFHKESTTIYYPGFNLNFLGELNEKLLFQGEINFEPADLRDLHIEIFRAYLDYRLNPKFNLQVGKFLSPIGYLNRNQRIYGYLNNSVIPRDMVWENYGFIPGFTLGLQVYGTFDAGSSAIKYYLAYGQNRATLPHGQTIALGHINEGENSNPGVSGIVEYFIPTGSGEISIGLSGYLNPSIKTNYIELGQRFDSLAPVTMKLSEKGFTPYFRLDASKFQFFTEFHSIQYSDETGVAAKEKYNYTALTAELMYKTKAAGKPFGPYIRYDMRNVDRGHPFYGLNNDGVLRNSFVPDQSELIVGFVWDLFPSNRFKIEYAANFAGAATKGRLAVSTAFAF